MKTLSFSVLLISVYCLCGIQAAPVDSVDVTFALSANSLKCQDTFTHPDAFVKIYSYIKSASNNDTLSTLEFVGSTDYVKDNENPDWREAFTFRWVRGTGQTWIFKVFDHDHINRDDFIGLVEVSVDRFMESEGAVKVNLSQNGGSITIKRTLPFSFRISAKNLPLRDRYLFSNGLSDPYALITYRDMDDETEKFAYQTTVLTDNSNPTWPEIIQFSKYQPHGNQILRFRFYDSDTLSNDEFLGEAFADADSLADRSGKVTIPLQRSEGNATLILQMPHKEEPTREVGVDLHLTTGAPPIFVPLSTESGGDVNNNEIEYYSNDINSQPK